MAKPTEPRAGSRKAEHDIAELVGRVILPFEGLQRDAFGGVVMKFVEGEPLFCEYALESGQVSGLPENPLRPRIRFDRAHTIVETLQRFHNRPALGNEGCA